MKEYLLFCRPLLSTDPVVTVSMISRARVQNFEDGLFEYGHYATVALKSGNHELQHFIQQENERRRQGLKIDIDRQLAANYLHFILCNTTKFDTLNLSEVESGDLCEQFWWQMTLTGSAKYFTEEYEIYEFIHFGPTFTTDREAEINENNQLVVLSRGDTQFRVAKISPCLGLYKNYLYFHPILLRYEKELKQALFTFHQPKWKVKFDKQQKTLVGILQEIGDSYNISPNYVTHRSYTVLTVLMRYLREQYKIKPVKWQSKINAFLHDKKQADRMLNLKGMSSHLIFAPLRNLRTNEDIQIFASGPRATLLERQLQLNLMNLWCWNLDQTEYMDRTSNQSYSEDFLI